MKLQRKIPLAIALAMLLALTAGGLGLGLAYAALRTFHVEVQTHTAHEREVLTMQGHFKTQIQEWKNVILRGSDTALYERHWKAFEREEATVIEGARRLKAGLAEPQQMEVLERFMAAHAQMARTYRQGREKFDGAGFDASVGDMAVRGIDREPAQLLDALARQIAEHSAQVAQAAYQQGHQALVWSVALMSLAAAGGTLVGWRISRGVVQPLVSAIGIASSVAEGHLDQRIMVKGRDETGQLLGALAHMQAQLTHLVSQVRERADVVALASGEIASGNADLSMRTERQAAALQETAASMQELSDNVRRNADTAARATDLAHQARAAVTDSGERVGEVVRTMRAIEDSSRRIADIVSVIDGIAFQTNILALNAAVEAARAGEEGRGFAVVASEVRSLAGRAAEAARQVRHLIASSGENVAQGTVMVDSAGQAMNGVVGAIEDVAALLRDIATATGEQRDATQLMSQTVRSLDETTQQNSALVEQTSAAAESLNLQARALVSSVAPFRLA